MAAVTIDQAMDLALGHFNAGRFGESEGICKQVLAVQPLHGMAMNMMAAIAGQSGRVDLGIQWIRRAVAAYPAVAAFQGNLAELLRAAGKLDEAAAVAEGALALDRNSADIWFTLGTAQLQNHQQEKAIESLGNAIRLRPAHGNSYNNLGAVFESFDRLEEAAAAYQRAIELAPMDSSPRNNLGVAYARLGRLDEAIECYRKAVELSPGAYRMHSHLIYTMLHHPGFDAGGIFAAHLDWAKRHAEPLTRGKNPGLRGTLDPASGGRLTVGYVSPNFRGQAVAYFSEPMIANHDRSGFRVICYHDCANFDDVTKRISAKAEVWRPVAGWSDEQLAEQIRADQVDILVDLNGHIPNHRLLMFARKPAPIQVTYIGYQTTTGMSAMDYRITDGVADPVGVTDQFHTEKLVRLPVFFAYKPLENGPRVEELPADGNGFVTFGSMNNFVKVGPGVIEAWSRILREVPNSRLMILIAGGAKGNGHVGQAFAAYGIDPARLQLVPMGGVREYLGLFHRIDIALDPFPFSGHTTTCDAIWMGVPVVTLLGQMYAGRMAASVLTSLGAEGWIGKSVEEYVGIARTLAADLDALREIRLKLRGRFQDSPAMDGAGFTRNLEEAYWEMWKERVHRASRG